MEGFEEILNALLASRNKGASDNDSADPDDAAAAGAFGEQIGADGESAPAMGIDLMKFLPMLLGNASCAKGTCDPDKLRLIHALRPFLSERTAPNIDRAIRLATIARIARGAFHSGL